MWITKTVNKADGYLCIVFRWAIKMWIDNNLTLCVKWIFSYIFHRSFQIQDLCSESSVSNICVERGLSSIGISLGAHVQQINIFLFKFIIIILLFRVGGNVYKFVCINVCSHIIGAENLNEWWKWKITALIWCCWNIDVNIPIFFFLSFELDMRLSSFMFW